jgi:hypothetical protein
MSKIEQIEFDRFPIWDKQSDEPEDSFNLFKLFFLPQVRPDLTNAYRAYCESLGDVKGRSKIAVKEPPRNWRVACERDRWRERHRAYYRKVAQDNLQWQQERLRELAEIELNLANRLFTKADQILSLQVNPDIDRLKDSAALIRCGSELSRKALGQDNLNAAFALLIRNGFEVIDPTLSVIELDKIQGANND